MIIKMAVVGDVMRGASKSGALCADCWHAASEADVHGTLTFFTIKKGVRPCIICTPDRRKAQ